MPCEDDPATAWMPVRTQPHVGRAMLTKVYQNMHSKYTFIAISGRPDKIICTLLRVTFLLLFYKTLQASVTLYFDLV